MRSPSLDLSQISFVLRTPERFVRDPIKESHHQYPPTYWVLAKYNQRLDLLVLQAYVEFVECMGGVWFERNMSEYLHHVLNLVANQRACPTHVDAVYARKCVLFILRSVIGSVLSEKAQISAAKEICQVIIKHMNALGLLYVLVSEIIADLLLLS